MSPSVGLSVGREACRAFSGAWSLACGQKLQLRVVFFPSQRSEVKILFHLRGPRSEAKSLSSEVGGRTFGPRSEAELFRPLTSESFRSDL
jgi:hypothetical protein